MRYPYLSVQIKLLFSPFWTSWLIEWLLAEDLERLYPPNLPWIEILYTHSSLGTPSRSMLSGGNIVPAVSGFHAPSSSL